MLWHRLLTVCTFVCNSGTSKVGPLVYNPVGPKSLLPGADIPSKFIDLAERRLRNRSIHRSRVRGPASQRLCCCGADDGACKERGTKQCFYCTNWFRIECLWTQPGQQAAKDEIARNNRKFKIEGKIVLKWICPMCKPLKGVKSSAECAEPIAARVKARADRISLTTVASRPDRSFRGDFTGSELNWDIAAGMGVAARVNMRERRDLCAEAIGAARMGVTDKNVKGCNAAAQGARRDGDVLHKPIAEGSILTAHPQEAILHTIAREMPVNQYWLTRAHGSSKWAVIESHNGRTQPRGGRTTAREAVLDFFNERGAAWRDFRPKSHTSLELGSSELRAITDSWPEPVAFAKVNNVPWACLREIGEDRRHAGCSCTANVVVHALAAALADARIAIGKGRARRIPLWSALHEVKSKLTSGIYTTVDTAAVLRALELRNAMQHNLEAMFKEFALCSPHGALQVGKYKLKMPTDRAGIPKVTVLTEPDFASINLDWHRLVGCVVRSSVTGLCKSTACTTSNPEIGPAHAIVRVGKTWVSTEGSKCTITNMPDITLSNVKAVIYRRLAPGEPASDHIDPVTSTATASERRSSDFNMTTLLAGREDIQHDDCRDDDNVKCDRDTSFNYDRSRPHGLQSAHLHHWHDHDDRNQDNCQFVRGQTPVGLSNLGNTCYINAVVQALFASTRFRHVLSNVSDERGSCCLSMLSRLFGSLQASTSAWISPNEFVNTCQRTLKFLQGDERERQQDAHEFLMHLIGESSVLFGPGETTTQTYCKICRAVKLKKEVSPILSFPFSSEAAHGHRTDSMEDMLARYLEIERFDADNMYECSNCKQHTHAIRQQKITKAPACLILHLQRFKWVAEHGRSEKVMTVCTVPHDLNIPVEKSGRLTHVPYKLTAILTHQGECMTTGHYITYALTESLKWYCFDDTRVMPISVAATNKFEITEKTMSFDLIKKETPYILFYEQTLDVSPLVTLTQRRQFKRHFALPKRNIHSADKCSDHKIGKQDDFDSGDSSGQKVNDQNVHTCDKAGNAPKPNAIKPVVALVSTTAAAAAAAAAVNAKLTNLPSSAYSADNPPADVPGWGKAFDNKSGRWYFWNKLTRKSQWKPPEAIVVHKPPRMRPAALKLKSNAKMASLTIPLSRNACDQSDLKADGYSNNVAIDKGDSNPDNHGDQGSAIIDQCVDRSDAVNFSDYSKHKIDDEGDLDADGYSDHDAIDRHNHRPIKRRRLELDAVASDSNDLDADDYSGNEADNPDDLDNDNYSGTKMPKVTLSAALMTEATAVKSVEIKAARIRCDREEFLVHSDGETHGAWRTSMSDDPVLAKAIEKYNTESLAARGFFQDDAAENGRRRSSRLRLESPHEMLKKFLMLRDERAMQPEKDTSMGGWAVVAARDIRKNDVVGEYIGELLSAEDGNKLYDKPGENDMSYLFFFNHQGKDLWCVLVRLSCFVFCPLCN